MRAVSEYWRCERRPGCYKYSWNRALAAYLPTFQMFKVVDLADRLSLVPTATCSCRASCPLAPCLSDRPAASCSCRLAFPPEKSCTSFLNPPAAVVQRGGTPLIFWVGYPALLTACLSFQQQHEFCKMSVLHQRFSIGRYIFRAPRGTPVEESGKMDYKG